MKKPFAILLSRPYLIALTLLICNDAILKTTYHNWLTGKFSDFAGLFAFSIFMGALSGRAYRKVVYFLVALFFVFWKSSFSQGLIDAINGLDMLNYVRVVDFTDLIALIVLPLAYSYQNKYSVGISESMAPVFVLVLSCVAFVATSVDDDARYIYLDESYDFSVSSASLVSKASGIDSVRISFSYQDSIPFLNSDTAWAEISLYSFNCSARMVLQSHFIMKSDTTSQLDILGVYEYCEDDDEKVSEKVSKEIEELLIDPIRNR